MRATPPFGVDEGHESLDVGPGGGSALGILSLPNGLSNGR